jgi:hypothetical protein
MAKKKNYSEKAVVHHELIEIANNFVTGESELSELVKVLDRFSMKLKLFIAGWR